MNKTILTIFLLFSTFGFGQSTTELKSEIDQIKKEINTLRNEINSVKSQNLYLKKALDINNPILKLEKNNTTYQITKVVGNRKEKTISINFLIISKDENKTSIIQDFSVVDLNGNVYKADLYKSSDTNPKLTVGVPINVKIVFKDVVDEIQILKLFNFSTRNEPEINSANFSKSIQEFRDLNVIWE
ncbi:transposase [Faecalibacter macacae]|uniref:Transposase n=1 Tax=Faecalibacter macacae TaxID=1859289 RepID=A0A3L9MBX5_9FLAO|nr:transposase [Faecalibacter macacae]RLZ10498.1 transposase [Faecalibacter macacae]